MEEDILNKFKRFQSRSKARYSGLFDRIRDNRKFLSNKQWGKRDDKFISKMRNRITVNVISNQCNSVANSYAAYPFTWFVGEPDIDKKIDDFFDNDANASASQEALLDTASFGLGVMALGSDSDESGNNIPVIYSVDDLERVLLDADMTELDGSDAIEGALIDYRSREWIRVHMGEAYLPDERAKSVLGEAGCSELVPIITYYVLDTDGCHVYTFVNDKEVTETEIGEDGAESVKDNVIPIHRVPIFPVWGERMWDDNDKKTYCGLVSKTEDVQRIVNYAFTQLAERLGLSPKPQWEGTADAFKGLDKYYKDAGSGLNPIIPHNRLANDKKTVLEAPKRFDNTVQFSDVQGIVSSTLDMLPSITGVDSKGLADVETDVTATAVEYTSKVFKNNIRHFISHLRTTFKSLGDTVVALMGFDGVKVKVTQGPEHYMELQVARQEITALMPMVDPSQKQALVNALLRTHPCNEVLAQLYAEINSEHAPTQQEMQLQQLCEQMKAAIDGKDQEILNLTQQLEETRKQVENTDKGLRADLLKAQMQHEYKMEEIALQSQLNGNADAEKAAAEADKAQMDVESKAIALETQKVKSAAEMAKAMQQPVIPGVV
jgi:hypothetical protein